MVVEAESQRTRQGIGSTLRISGLSNQIITPVAPTVEAVSSARLEEPKAFLFRYIGQHYTTTWLRPAFGGPGPGVYSKSRMASREKGQPYEGMVRDPCPPGGYPPVIRRPNPESDFQEAHWPKSKIKAIQTINKGRAQELFKLRNEDMCDLYHRCTEGPAKNTNRIVIWKLYFQIQCERRGWEIHGGPKGLAYAQRSCDWNRAHRARTSGSNVSPSQGTSAVVFNSAISSPQKSRTNFIRPKGLRLDSSTREDGDDIQETDAKSEDDSWDLIPLSTPKRKHGKHSLTTPQKKFKPSSKGAGDEGDPFQLPTPVSTAKKSVKMSTREDVLEMQDSDDQEQTLPSLLPIKRSKSSSIQTVPATPLKRDNPPFPLTPSSSQKSKPQKKYLGTLDCDWGSDHEVRVSWIS